jgi:hypothetical protein
MQQQNAQSIQKCPNCEADPRYRIWENIHGVHGPISVTSDSHRFMGSNVKALVCKQCGYIQLFINPKDFYKGNDINSNKG